MVITIYHPEVRCACVRDSLSRARSRVRRACVTRISRRTGRTRITLFAGHAGDCRAICRACVRRINLARPSLTATQIVASSNNYRMPVGASRADLIASPNRKRREIAKRSPETKRVMRDVVT